MRARGYRGEDSFVFTAPQGGPLQYHNVRTRVLMPTVEALGLEWVVFHSFRHTCASLLFANGRDVKQVQKWLGHAKASFTLDTYVHLMDDGVGSADFMDQWASPGAIAGATRHPQPLATAGTALSAQSEVFAG
jgi:integrase